MELTELKKGVSKKRFMAERDRIVSYLYYRGVTFLGITINYPRLWKKRIRREMAVQEIRGNIKYYLQHSIAQIDLIEFASLSIEIHSRNKNDDLRYPRIHILIGFRALRKFEQVVFDKIKEKFNEEDIRIECLKEYRDITKFWNYLTKEIEQKEDLKRFYILNYREDSELYGPIQEFLDFEQGLGNTNTGTYPNHRDKNVLGINLRKIKNDEIVLINLLNVFVTEQLMFINSGLVYQKDFNSQYSYRCIGNFDDLFSLIGEILNHLVSRFPLQLNEDDIQILIIEQLESAIKKIKLAPALLPRRKILTEVVEFRDGLYNTKLDQFVSFDDDNNFLIETLKKDAACLRFFNVDGKELENISV
jgi:hypothetical protein